MENLDITIGTILLLSHPEHSELPPVEAEIVGNWRQCGPAIGVIVQYRGEWFYRHLTYAEFRELKAII
jgi:hypothetical protein